MVVAEGRFLTMVLGGFG
jgi:hypothetical protein